MKKLFIILLSILSIGVFSQTNDTISTQSKITDVTVFFSGAQISRQVEFKANKGVHILHIDKLAMGLTEESILVKEIKSCKTLSVKHDVKISKDNDDIVEINKLEKQIKDTEFKIKQLSNESNIYDIEERLLLDNSKLARANNGVSISALKEAADFYRIRLNEIRQNKLQLSVKISDERDIIKGYNSQLNKLRSSSDKIYSELFISIDCKSDVSTKFEISYYIKTAGWEPIYDFRVKDVKSSLNIDYNATVFQSTGEDWKDVKLTLSTNNPLLNSDKPEIHPWYIDRYKSKRRGVIIRSHEDYNFGTLKGKVLEAGTNEPVPFANVVIELNGTQIAGTSTDFDGNYVIKPIPSGTFDLVSSSIGYTTHMVSNISIYPGKVRFFDIEMQGSALSLDDIEIVNYKVPLIQKDYTSTGSTVTAAGISKMPNRNATSIATTVGGVYSADGRRSSIRGSRSDETVTYIDGAGAAKYSSSESANNFISTNYLTNEVEKKLSNLEYEIKTPYTIPSDGKDYTLKIKETKVPVEYVYYVIPKLEEDAFLTAQIPKWNELDLLSGKSSIYYQGTFTGESSIDAAFSGDTLDVSLGRDREILISRKGNKEKLERKVLGRSIKETLSWDIEIKNNKNTAVNIILEDQFPLAENKSIEIELLEISGAKADDKTGKLVWEFTLEPNTKKTLNITYSVKYPRYVKLYMD